LNEDLWKCTRNGWLAQAKQLLNRGADVHADNDAALAFAIYRGSQESWGPPMVQLLLQHGANPNARVIYDREYDRSMLEIALDGSHTASSDPRIVMSLLRSGADVRRTFSQGGTPISDALTMGDDFRPSLQESGQKPVGFAIARAMLARGATVEDRDKTGQTPLMRVVTGALDTSTGTILPPALSFLLARGANVNARDKHGWTPLMFAIAAPDWIESDQPGLMHSFQVPVMQALLKRGANVNARDWKGRTPLILVVARSHAQSNLMWPKKMMALRLLIARGANVNARDARGWTPLLHAVNAYYYDVEDTSPNVLDAIKLLIGHDADVKLRANDGTSVLQLARKEYNVTKVLREAGAR
jgi:ankyrin repeat protein